MKPLRPLIISIIFILYGQLAYAQTDNGLLAWWRFDEGSGTSASDSSGNGKTGTLNSSPSWVAGKFGDALSFNGTSSYVSSSNFADNLSNFTVAAWIKTSATQPQSCGGIIVAKLGAAGVNSANGWALEMNASGCLGVSGAIAATIQSNSSNNYYAPYTTAAYNDGKWHHVAMVVSGVSSVKLYVDGVYPAQSVSTNSTVGSFTNTGTVNVAVDTTTGADYFNGIVDEVRIYNRSLSAGEIYELFENGAGTHHLGTAF